MSVNPKHEMTATETAIVENFGQKIGDLPGDSDVMSTRDNALEAFKQLGLPSRKIESWHYTDLRTLLKSVAPFTDTGDGRAVDPLLMKNHVLAINNGKSLDEVSVSGLKTSSLSDALAKDDYKFRNEIADDDFIGQLNTAFAADGWVIDIADETKLDAPIELQNIQSGGQSHVYSEVNVGKNSQAVIIERQIGDDTEALLSSVVSLNADSGSDVTWIIIRNRGFNANQFAQFRSKLGVGTKLTLYIVNIASVLNRQELDIELEGNGSDFQLRTINLLAGQSHSDLTMVIRHIDENSTSTEVVRNVVMDKARGVFQGMIRVAKEAQKTDARMACNSLILSDDAEYDAKPELEIFADDVACGHGATVAEIDHAHLFYLMARGIPLPKARGLLIKAFVAELIDNVENEDIQNVLAGIIDQWLETTHLGQNDDETGTSIDI